jgi:putative membrane protein
MRMGFLGEPFIFVGVLFMLVFWGAIIYLLVSVVRGPRSRTDSPAYGGRRRSLEVLEELYARGEIDRDEFLERRSVLLGGAEPPT